MKKPKNWRRRGVIVQPRSVMAPSLRMSIKRMENAVEAFLHSARPKIIADVLAAYESVEKAGKKKGPVEQILEAVDLSVFESLSKKVKPIIEAAYKDAGHDALGRVAVAVKAAKYDPDAFNQVDTNAASFAADRAAEMVGMRVVGDKLVPNPNAEWRIDEATRDGIRTAVQAAVEGHLPVKDLRQGLVEAYGFSSARAQMIAQTEMNRAHGEGALAGYKASGVELKVWIAAPDSCDECVENEDEGPIPIDEKFQSGDETDPAHPNCTCTIAAFSEFDDNEEG